MKNEFGNKLSIARNMAGYSMQELADRVNLSKQSISKYEAGLINPDSTVLIKLAEALGVQLDFFTDEVGPNSIELKGIKHREKHRLSDSEFSVIKKLTVQYISRLIELELLATDQKSFVNPVSDLSIESTKDAEKAAKTLRKKWGLGEQPIRNVVLLLEEKGIKVYCVKHNTSFQGFSAWANKVPVIVLNSTVEEKTRIRFSAIHELGHLLLNISNDISDDGLIEAICDAFAGEVLFPSSMVIVEFGKERSMISQQELVNIKEKFGISIKAIMVRAREAGVVSSNIYKVWTDNYNQWYSNSSNFGRFQSDEEPKRFDQLLFHCLIEQKISIRKAAQLKDLKESSFRKYFSRNISLFNPEKYADYYQ